MPSRVVSLVAQIIDSPLGRVRTYITEIPAENWSIGGVPASRARADQVEARRRAAGE